MTFEEAQQAARAWMRQGAIGVRWIRFETEPTDRVLVKEGKTAEWLEFWPSPHKNLGLVEVPEAAAARLQERAAILSLISAAEVAATPEYVLARLSVSRSRAETIADAMSQVLRSVREGIERGDHLR